MDYTVKKIPGGIHVECADKLDIIDHDLEVTIFAPDNTYVRYNIETGDKVQKKHYYEHNYYSNINGYKFEVKPGMCSARVSSTAVLFHNNIDGNYHVYKFDGTYVDMIDGKKIYSEYDMDRIRRFEFYNTYSLLYSESEDLTVVIYDHINKQSKEFVCGEWQLFERIVPFHDTREDLYIYIEHDGKCDLITVNLDNPSDFKTKSNTYDFGSECYWQYFITYIGYTILPDGHINLSATIEPSILPNRCSSADADRFCRLSQNNGPARRGYTPLLIAVDGYHVEMRNITSKLPLSKSFNLKYMEDIYAYFDNEAGGIPIEGTPYIETFANNAEIFIRVNKGKLYYNKFDGILNEMNPNKNEYMAIDLHEINESGEYTPIPLLDLISDEDKKLIATYYSDQPIIGLQILENQYVFTFPDNKFVAVSDATYSVDGELN
jgi:hypothetical protein